MRMPRQRYRHHPKGSAPHELRVLPPDSSSNARTGMQGRHMGEKACKMTSELLGGLPGHVTCLFPPVQADRARLLALASEEELALMKKTQQLAEEVRVSCYHGCWSFQATAPCRSAAMSKRPLIAWHY